MCGPCVEYKAGAAERNLVTDVLPLPTQWRVSSEVYADNAFLCLSLNILTTEYASSVGNVLTCIFILRVFLLPRVLFYYVCCLTYFSCRTAG